MGRFLYAFRCDFDILIVALGIRVKILKSPIKNKPNTITFTNSKTVLKNLFFLEQAFCNDSCVVGLSVNNNERRSP